MERPDRAVEADVGEALRRVCGEDGTGGPRGTGLCLLAPGRNSYTVGNDNDPHHLRHFVAGMALSILPDTGEKHDSADQRQ
jgi:hypothetical protein